MGQGRGEPETFVVHRRVAYSECDMQEWVFHPQYFYWLDEALVDLWRERIGSYASFSAGGHEYVVAEISARFLDGARFEEEIQIEITIDSLTRTSLTAAYVIRAQERTLVEASIRYVCVSGGKKAPWPAEVRAALEPI